MSAMPSQAPDQGGGSGRLSSIDLGTSAAGVVNAVSRTVREELAPDELSYWEYAFLRALQESGTGTATQLGRLLPVKQPRISRLVAGLVKKGLLRRRRQQSDRRKVTLELTDEGESLTNDLRRRVEEHYAALLKGVSSEEVDGFVSTASRIMANRAAAEASN